VRRSVSVKADTDPSLLNQQAKTADLTADCDMEPGVIRRFAELGQVVFVTEVRRGNRIVNSLDCGIIH
jgi:hypothetical protein